MITFTTTFDDRPGKLTIESKMPDGVSFNASFSDGADEVLIVCIVTTDALKDRFGAKVDTDYLPVFERNREVIQSVAKRLIESGRTEPYKGNPGGGHRQIVIKKSDFS